MSGRARFMAPSRWGETDCVEWLREAAGEPAPRPAWLPGAEAEALAQFGDPMRAAEAIARATGRAVEAPPAGLETGDILVAERFGALRLGVVLGPGDVVYRTARGLTRRGGRVVARLPARGEG